MTDIGKYVKVNGFFYKIYSYTFTYIGEPTDIIFHSGKNSVNAKFSDTNNRYTHAGLASEDELALELYDKEQTYRTIYFIDKASWGAENTKVHIWGENGEITPWAANEPMTDTGMCTTVDGKVYPVYSYTYSYIGKPTNVIIHSSSQQTATLNWVDEGYYWYETSVYTPLTSSDITLQDKSQYQKTIYFIDRQEWGAENTLVHLWGDNGDLKKWADNEPVTDTGKFAELDEAYYPLYSYTFTYFGNPTNVIFHVGNGVTTGDLDFVDGGYYSYNGSTTLILTEAPEIFDERPEDPIRTVYFADTGTWGLETTRIHLWSENGAITDWNDLPAMTPTGRYILVNDNQWAPVYKYTFQNYKPIGLLFIDIYIDPSDPNRTVYANGQHVTADYQYEDNMCYVYNGPKSYYPPMEIDLESLPTELPRINKPATFIVNLGANQLAENGQWRVPCCHVARRGTENYAIPQRGTDAHNKEIMTMIEPGMYSITIDEIGDANDVIFYSYGASEESVPFPYTASGSHCFDPTNWTTYAFDIGLNCVHQSFLTPEEYLRIREKDVESIFLTGDPIIDPSFDGKDPAKTIELIPDEGIFVHKFTVNETEGMLFKLTWIDVKKYKDAANAVDEVVIGDKPSIRYDSQRSWATYNYGIIGCETESTQEWRDKHILESAGLSRRVVLYLNNTMGYNSSTQYGWYVSAAHGNIPPGDCWLVVDTHKNDRSVSLLSFDPNPGIIVTDVTYNTLDLAPEQATTLSDPSTVASAAAVNGPLVFDKVNVINGVADVEATGNVLLEKNDYSVVYSVYLDKIRVNSYKGVPTTIDVPYMSAGEDANIAVRARYTDNDTHKSFCSHFAKGSVAADLPDLVTPISNVTDKQLLHYTWEEGKPILSAAAALSYEPDVEKQLAYFPDFELMGITVDGTEVSSQAKLIHSGHQIIAENLFNSYLKNWTPEADSADTQNLDGEDSDGNEISDPTPATSSHWSNLISENGNIPLILDGLCALDDFETRKNVNVEFKVKAIHPFIVRRVDIETASETDPAAAPRRIESRISLPSDLENFTIVTPTKSTVVNADLTTAITTGVSTISSDSAKENAEPEYFNLGGIKVDIRSAAPGLYLKRTGSTTEKIIVR